MPPEGEYVVAVNAVLAFRDEYGQEWLCAASLGPLIRYKGGREVETMDHEQVKDRAFMLHELKLVTDA